MNPVAVKLAQLALKFVVASPSLLKQFGDSVKTMKRLAPTDADVQALPDDAAAIEQFAAATQAALQENARIAARLRERSARESEGDTKGRVDR